MQLPNQRLDTEKETQNMYLWQHKNKTLSSKKGGQEISEQIYVKIDQSLIYVGQEKDFYHL